MIKNAVYYMKRALKEAEKAKKADEVPIGAIIVQDDKIIARAFNQTEKTNLPTAHAEISAINKACKKLKSWRLENSEMYITVEPCPMCAGAICNARIKKVYFGAYEPKSGCAISKFNILSDSGLNHKTDFEGGILGEECSKLLTDYFREKRQQKK